MKKIKVVWCILSVALMALIFFFSHQTADVSSDTSGPLARLLAKVLSLIFKGRAYETVLWVCQWIVRKSAHFILFAFLGVCVYNTLNFGTRKSRVVIAVIICILYAISDEIHQICIPGRAGRIGDVLIDGTGSISAIAILMRSAHYALKKRR